MCSCRFESYPAQCYSRCGDALVVRPSTPLMIDKLAGESQFFCDHNRRNQVHSFVKTINGKVFIRYSFPKCQLLC